MKYRIALIIVIASVAWWHGSAGAEQAQSAAGTSRYELANEAYRLAVQVVNDKVNITLDDRKSSLRLSDAPYFYSARLRGNAPGADSLGIEPEEQDPADRTVAQCIGNGFHAPKT